ncbi:MAG TPA: hypothetical protein VHA52_13665 [Candidatus Babeliaceae bacterium]|nr:hypothetical protein [Candidatus Babeliaceae bacterium]
MNASIYNSIDLVAGLVSRKTLRYFIPQAAKINIPLAILIIGISRSVQIFIGRIVAQKLGYPVHLSFAIGCNIVGFVASAACAVVIQKITQDSAEHKGNNGR